MTDSGEFKQLVRRRMEATGEKYTTAYRALLDAARSEVLPPGLRILPRIAARYAEGPSPSAVRLRLFRTADLEIGVEELRRYVRADADQRDEMVFDWLQERIDEFDFLEGLVSDHGVVYPDEDETRDAWREASDLGITADQYAWLDDRLTDEELQQLSDDDMRQLLSREYTPYPDPE